MSNYPDLLGNEPSNGSTIAREGCYITTFANLISSAIQQFETKFSEKNYSNPRLINNDKSLFLKNSGELNGRSNSMNAIFGEENWDYWTKSGQGGSEGLLSRLSDYDKDIDGYMIVGIFDLSSATSEVTNHMVGINGMPNADGIFEDIVPTSNGDKSRLSDSNKKKSYCIENFKEFRVIKVTEFYKCTQGE